LEEEWVEVNVLEEIGGICDGRALEEVGLFSI
jgi:hypothetical protein